LLSLGNNQLKGEKNYVQKKEKHIMPTYRCLDDGIGINGGDGCLTV
jgi:hypothetical protein